MTLTVGASSFGSVDERIGAVVSPPPPPHAATSKFNAVASVIPAKAFPASSSSAVASMLM